ncbi:hypothetical protein [Sinosporangium siamense]|uniref:Uncharacterized protein n=1 Tax=Sinosporangium siamense TaxID=1367973 RepID=A0A919RC22_9ACTN|nr:hypothetical protein [Sinosporangium siamense]GII91138.1 hypothetical protein Ssi02_13690 [Sinosporangium siamense]
MKGFGVRLPILRERGDVGPVELGIERPEPVEGTAQEVAGGRSVQTVPVEEVARQVVGVAGAVAEAGDGVEEEVENGRVGAERGRPGVLFEVAVGFEISAAAGDLVAADAGFEMAQKIVDELGAGGPHTGNLIALRAAAELPGAVDGQVSVEAGEPFGGDAQLSYLLAAPGAARHPAQRLTHAGIAVEQNVVHVFLAVVAPP